MRDNINKITEFLFKNIRIKFFALLMAGITWYAVHKAINLELNVENIKVDILLKEGWTVREQSADSVDIRFRGSQDDLRYLHPNAVKVIIDDPESENSGMQTIEFKARHVKTPGGAQPLTFRPEKIMFQVDKEDKKTIPVKVDLVGEPPVRYEVLEVKIQPESIQITGPLRRLGEIQEVKTAPISLLGQMTSFKTRVALVSQNVDWEARLEPEKVNVEVTIIEQSSNVDLDQVVVRALTDPNKPSRVRLDPGQIKVVLKGRVELMDKLELGMIRAYVDCSQLSPPGTSQVPVKVHTPDHIEVKQILPPTVEVRLESLIE